MSKPTKAPAPAMDAAELSEGRAAFMEKRQAELDAQAEEDSEIEDRDEYGSGFNNPPSPRATDGGKPGTKEVPVLKKAQELEGPAQKAQAEQKANLKAAKKAAKKAS